MELMEIERDMVVARTSEQYRAAMAKDWKKLEDECEGTANLPITVSGDTALHIAVYSGEVDLVGRLLEFVPNIQVINNRGDTVLHLAAETGKVNMAEFLLQKDKSLHNLKNKRGETPLFRAAAFGRTNMVSFLAQTQEAMELGTMRGDDDTCILHIAVLSKYFDTALQLLKIKRSLLYLRDQSGMTCLQLLANMPSAFKSGIPMTKLEWLLYHCLPDDDYDLEDSKHDETRNTSSQRDHQDLECGCGWRCPRRCSFWIDGRAISRRYAALWRRITQQFECIRRLWYIKKQQKRAVKLVKALAEEEYETCMNTNLGGRPDRPDNICLARMDKDDQDQGTEEEESPDLPPMATISPTSESPLLSAAKNGIIEIVEIILKEYPEAIEVINEQHENIFHVAVKYRMKKILDLLQNWPAPTSRLRSRINLNNDSILHQAAYLSVRQLTDRPGAALRMQSEIQWFERVRKLVPPYFINHRNKKNQTAKELFTTNHEALTKDGQKWIDQTTKACIIVAVLIATVAFTCAYTTPGGSNSKTGHPVLIDKTLFRIFSTSDTLSLCFSLTSVVLFLSIMTSKMDQKDFRRSLPLKLVLGLTTLFLSVAAMMVAFAVTLVLMVENRLHSAAIPIYTIACCPVALFLVLEFPLYLNIAWYTVRDMRQSIIDFLPLPLPSGTRRIRSSVHY